MRKLVFSAAALVMLALSFTSCKKYEVSAPLDLSELPTVTVKGDLYAELDKTNNVKEKAPSGLTVTVSIPLSDYNPSNTSGGNHIITTTVDGNGKFSIEVPVLTSGVNATISFESFTATVLEDVGQTDISEKTSLFELADIAVPSLGTGNAKTLLNLGTLEYLPTSSDPNAGSFNPTTSINYEGNLTYASKRKVGVDQPDTLIYSPVPDGTELLVKIVSKNEFGDKEFHKTITVTTSSNGKYSFSVPLVNNGTAAIEITSMKILEFDDIILDVKSLNVNDLNVTDNLYFVNYTNKDYQYIKGTFVQEVE